MGRLTERFSNGQAAVYGCGDNCKYDYKYCNNHYKDCPTINEIYEKLAAYEDIIDDPEKLRLVDELYLEKCEEVNRLKAELAEYKKLEDEGLLLRLPISEDTPVYSIEYCCGKNKENKMGMCFRGFCEGCSDKSYYIKEGKAKQCSISEINRSVFLTKEEADQALERMKEVQDDN